MSTERVYSAFVPTVLHYLVKSFYYPLTQTVRVSAMWGLSDHSCMFNPQNYCLWVNFCGRKMTSTFSRGTVQWSLNSVASWPVSPL